MNQRGGRVAMPHVRFVSTSAGIWQADHAGEAWHGVAYKTNEEDAHQHWASSTNNYSAFHSMPAHPE